MHNVAYDPLDLLVTQGKLMNGAGNQTALQRSSSFYRQNTKRRKSRFDLETALKWNSEICHPYVCRSSQEVQGEFVVFIKYLHDAMATLYRCIGAGRWLILAECAWVHGGKTRLQFWCDQLMEWLVSQVGYHSPQVGLPLRQDANSRINEQPCCLSYCRNLGIGNFFCKYKHAYASGHHHNTIQTEGFSCWNLQLYTAHKSRSCILLAGGPTVGLFEQVCQLVRGRMRSLFCPSVLDFTLLFNLIAKEPVWLLIFVILKT